ncbi:GPI mannosyltransferase 4 [Ooceraea biroi]|uniref:Mannosyltransferase n=1 Tax=Ooceraea biroi TaxID=2015173 RepID=A0A026WG59_OOCBI|nr:GPI mannosyltransferase 4 [Ooceraea biroi]XP_011337958.1 GPI mannosyltransferase 4 [Ooceraea biroi]EZA54636.1 GPI mannosyltransferase [Ooceraea biroi]
MSLKHKNEYRRSIDEYQSANPIRRKIGLYWILAALRITLTLAPQTGYIHPDEFFQSIEVVSGEHFDIDVYKPWEFNTTFPVRTAFIPQLVVGLPYVVLKMLSPYTFHLFGLSLKTPYFFVIFPRLFMCALSFLSDYFLYKICCMYGQNYRVRLVTYASSYIMLTYATRILSNSIELVLTAALLYLVSKCMVFSEKVVLQNDYISKKYSEATSGTERLKYYKLRALLPSHSLNHCFKLATITVIGIFNRPTFVAFALAPIFFWLQRGLGSKSVSLVDFHIRIFIFILYGLPVALFFILVDSFYYGYLTMGEIGQLEVGINNFVVTPVNFIKYNIDTKNLQTHGLHPRFLHFLLNVPLLFSILGLIGLLTFVKMVYRGITAQWLRLPRLQSIVGLMTTAFIVPVALLSLFPHQEPRFIIPVLFPLVFLYAPELNQVPSLDIVQRASFNDDSDVGESSSSTETKRHKSRKLVLWYISNLLLAFFYAFAHQGGILPLTFHVATELAAKPYLTNVHLYTSYSYSMPTALLQLRNTRKVYRSGNHKYKLTQDFHLYEQGSKPLPQVFNSIARSVRDCEEKFAVKKIPYRLYYALPASAMDELARLSNSSQSRQFGFHIVKAFYPHISVERLPLVQPVERLGNLFSRQNDGIFSSFVKAVEDVREYIEQFKLLLLRIEYFVPKTKRSKNNR